MKNGDMTMDSIINDTINDYTPGAPKKMVSMANLRKDEETGLLLSNKDKFEKDLRDYVENIRNEAQKFITYNDNLSRLDPRYSSMKMINGNIIVRCEVIEPTKIDSLGQETWVLPKVTVHIPNKSGYGTQEIDHPFPFKTKAIVVAKDPNIESVDVGDFIQIKSECIDMVGKPGSPVPVITRMFAHYDDANKLSEPNEPGYGYLMINLRDIICKL